MWVGFVVLITFFLMPTIEEAGPEGGKIMAGLAKRGLTAFIPSIAGLTVLTGIILFWLSGRFSAPNATPGGWFISVGALLGLIAAIVGGSVVGRGVNRAIALGAEAATTSDAKARAQILADLGKTRARVAAASKVVAVLLIVTVLLMAVGPHM
jgi:hypothetical protein